MDTKYCNDKEKLLNIINSCEYSTFVLNRYILYIQQLEEVTESYHGGIYTHQIGFDWARNTLNQGKSRWRNRIVEMLNDIRLGKSIQPGVRYSLNPIISICPQRFEMVLNTYINHLIKYSYSESTIKQERKCNIFFLQYIDSKRIKTLSEIELTTMEQFISEALNIYCLNTKRNYLGMIRGFFTYLAEQGLIPEKIIYYCPYIKNIPKKVPSILSPKVQKALQNLEKPTSEIVARDNAILLLTYRLGLRRGDTLDLKLSEIDWKNKSISILQQKTLVPLKLPLPDDVGDALSNYICNFRKPIKDQLFVFQTIKPPTRPLKYSASGATAERFQKRCGFPEEFHGLHICRRTCASLILNDGNTPELVSAVLGHSSMESIKYYISLDKEKMSCCAMSTSFIGYPEVLND